MAGDAAAPDQKKRARAFVALAVHYCAFDYSPSAPLGEATALRASTTNSSHSLKRALFPQTISGPTAGGVEPPLKAHSRSESANLLNTPARRAPDDAAAGGEHYTTFCAASPADSSGPTTVWIGRIDLTNLVQVKIPAQLPPLSGVRDVPLATLLLSSFSTRHPPPPSPPPSPELADVPPGGRVGERLRSRCSLALARDSAEADEHDDSQSRPKCRRRARTHDGRGPDVSQREARPLTDSLTT